MRIIALASAILLLGASGAWAQSTSTTTTGTDKPGSAASVAARAASGSGSSSGSSTGSTPASPLAGATSASGAVNSATEATQNGSVTAFVKMTDGELLPVFGTELFTGSFSGTRPTDRPDYLIQPGDQVVINLFGAVNNGSTQTVDSGGNVFILGVGPVHVAGTSAANVQSTVAGRVREVFTGAVGVYAMVSAAGSLGVYVSGDVNRPGRYTGGAHDSVMFFLSQAGGIDATRGSFRNVSVRRNGQVVATYDLYDFLLSGDTQPMRFMDGDVVFVSPRGSMVGVTGAVRNAFAFEAPRGSRQMTGSDLFALARLEPTVTGASLQGFRNGSHRSAYFPLPDFARVVLSDGDHVDFRSDTFQDLVTVNIVGEIKGPSVYVLPRGSTLSRLLAKIPLEGTDIEPRFVHIQRQGVAIEQKRALDQALYNLQKQVLTASPSTTEAAALITAQATLINQFVAQASLIEPDGNIAVYSNGAFQDVKLVSGDKVILPNRTDVVIVAGEVLNPGALAHANNLDLKGYVGRAGGYTENANKRKFVVRHLDGSAEVADAGSRPGAGDEIVVLPKVGGRFMQFAKDISQLLFQIAVTAGTVANLNN